eukprot:1784087-Prymnesium_polylepis.2
MILSMLSTEEKLLKVVSLVLNNHPAVVNSRDPVYGTSLLQFVVKHCPSAALVDFLLQVRYT